MILVIFHLSKVNMKFLLILLWHILPVFLIEDLLAQEITLAAMLQGKKLLEMVIGLQLQLQMYFKLPQNLKTSISDLTVLNHVLK